MRIVLHTVTLDRIFQIDKILSRTSIFDYWLICRRPVFQKYAKRTGSFERTNNLRSLGPSERQTKNALIINNPKFESLGKLDPWMSSINQSISETANVHILSNCVNGCNVIKGDLFANESISASSVVLKTLKILPVLIFLSSIVAVVLKVNPLNVLRVVMSASAGFSIQYQKMSSLLRSLKLDTVYLTDGISNLGLISACRTNGIRVVEVQHGLITSRIPNYHFEIDIENPKIFPNEILLYSSAWNESSAFPIGMHLGYFNSDILQLPDWLPKNQSKSNTIVLIGQRSHMDILVKDVLRLQRHLKLLGLFYSIIVVPHPSDSVEKYLAQFDKYSDISVLKQGSYLKNWPVAFIGAYSTTVFELLNLGKTVFVKEMFVQFLGDFASEMGLEVYDAPEMICDKLITDPAKVLLSKKQICGSVFSDEFKEGCKVAVSAGY